MASDRSSPRDAEVQAAVEPGGQVPPTPSATEAASNQSRRRRISTQGRLDLGDAIHDGWQAFCRAPRVFAAFALLVNLLILLQQPLLARIGNVAQPSRDPLAWGLYGLGLLLSLGLNLWGSLGLARGSVLALRGRRPSLLLLLRWDGAAWLRLLRSWLWLAVMVGVPAALALLLFGLPLLLLQAEPQLQQLLGTEATRLLALLLGALLLLSVALTLVALLYLAVNQVFLLQIVLLETCGGAAAVQRGRQLVDPQWPLVLLLLIATALLNGLGLLVCMVGSLVAWPAVICITTAAYQQLRDGEPQRPTR